MQSSDSLVEVRTANTELCHERLLLVGPLNARELRCAIQAFEPTSIGYDPFTLDIRVLRDQRSNIQPESLFVPEVAMPNELVQSFRSFVDQTVPEQSVGIVMSPKARFEECLAATSLAQSARLPLYYFAVGDSERLFSFPTHSEVFSLPPLFLKVSELLDQNVTIVGYECELLPSDQALVDTCVLLATHSDCCNRLISDFARRFKERHEKIWTSSGSQRDQHGRRLLLGLAELGILLQGKPFKHEGSWGARLNHNDHSKRLFQTGVWLEYAMAAAASKIPHVQDVQLRVQLKLSSSISKALGMRSDVREVDCMISTGSQLYCIECKSGEWDAQDLVYFGRLVEAIGAKGIFVSVSEHQVQRCQGAAKEAGVVLVTASDFTQQTDHYVPPCLND